jgi:hypothetical protein
MSFGIWSSTCWSKSISISLASKASDPYFLRIICARGGGARSPSNCLSRSAITSARPTRNP